MKKIYLILFTLLISFACSEKSFDEDFADEATLKSAQKVMNFRAHLSGDNEVPAVETMATGQAIFMLSKDGMTLHYKLIVANIEDVRMAHIHLAPAGTNGGVVAWLYPPKSPAVTIPGTSNGILAEGMIEAANLINALGGHPLSDLIDAMSSGGAYVNVHTVKYGGGEIRGQIFGN